MQEFLADIRGQQSLALFLIALMIVTFTAGFIIRKTRFFDIDRNSKSSASLVVGNYMMILSAILGITAIIAFLLSFVM